MGTFDTKTTNTGHITDRVTGEKIKSIISDYISDPISEELGDKIIEHLKREFGENHPIQVSLDDETGEIEVIVEDRNGKFIKCSSLKLFSKESS